MTTGFKLDCEDEEEALSVGQGQSEEQSTDITPAEAVAPFISMVEKLRLMGAVHVEGLGMIANFNTPEPAKPEKVVKREPKKKKPEEAKVFEGDTPEDIERRKGYAAIVEGLANG